MPEQGARQLDAPALAGSDRHRVEADTRHGRSRAVEHRLAVEVAGHDDLIASPEVDRTTIDPHPERGRRQAPHIEKPLTHHVVEPDPPERGCGGEDEDLELG